MVISSLLRPTSSCLPYILQNHIWVMKSSVAGMIGKCALSYLNSQKFSVPTEIINIVLFKIVRASTKLFYQINLNF